MKSASQKSEAIQGTESLVIPKRPTWKNLTKEERRTRFRDLKRLQKYGVTPRAYEEILVSQGGACAICGDIPAKGEEKAMGMDHNHETGRIRGILCSRCNCGLGLFCDSWDLLLKAIGYLRQHAANHAAMEELG